VTASSGRAGGGATAKQASEFSTCRFTNRALLLRLSERAVFADDRKLQEQEAAKILAEFQNT
jgi:hypothetical protein